jgi:hypothetical protein
MDRTLLTELEQSLLGWNSLLQKKLQPGLPEWKVRRALARVKAQGEIDNLITLYTWRDGTILDHELCLTKKGLFPGTSYHFLDLEMASGHFREFNQVSKVRPEVAEAVGRYFPAFWDGSTSWLAVDLVPCNRNRVMIVEFGSPIRQAYESFDAFITDVIRANREGAGLSCFGG